MLKLDLVLPAAAIKKQKPVLKKPPPISGEALIKGQINDNLIRFYCHFDFAKFSWVRAAAMNVTTISCKRACYSNTDEITE